MLVVNPVVFALFYRLGHSEHVHMISIDVISTINAALSKGAVFGGF